MSVKTEKERINGRMAALKRRADYLKGQLEKKDNGYARHELSAINWAIFELGKIYGGNEIEEVA